MAGKLVSFQVPDNLQDLVVLALGAARYYQLVHELRLAAPEDVPGQLLSLATFQANFDAREGDLTSDGVALVAAIRKDLDAAAVDVARGAPGVNTPNN